MAENLTIKTGKTSDTSAWSGLVLAALGGPLGIICFTGLMGSSDNLLAEEEVTATVDGFQSIAADAGHAAHAGMEERDESLIVASVQPPRLKSEEPDLPPEEEMRSWPPQFLSPSIIHRTTGTPLQSSAAADFGPLMRSTKHQTVVTPPFISSALSASASCITPNSAVPWPESTSSLFTTSWHRRSAASASTSRRRPDAAARHIFVSSLSHSEPQRPPPVSSSTSSLPSPPSIWNRTTYITSDAHNHQQRRTTGAATSHVMTLPHTATSFGIVPHQACSAGGMVPPHTATSGGMVPPHTATSGGMVPPNTATSGGTVPRKTATSGGTVQRKTATSGGTVQRKTGIKSPIYGIRPAAAGTSGGTVPRKTATSGGIILPQPPRSTISGAWRKKENSSDQYSGKPHNLNNGPRRNSSGRRPPRAMRRQDGSDQQQDNSVSQVNLPATTSHLGRFQCDICHKRLSTPKSLRGHTTRFHSGQVGPRVSCELCPRTFARHAHMKTHLNSHYYPERVQCQFCERYFSDAAKRNRHIRYGSCPSDPMREARPHRVKPKPLRNLQ